MKLICPVCSSVLHFEPANLEKRIQCSSCDSTFNPAKIKALYDQQQASIRRTEKPDLADSSINSLPDVNLLARSETGDGAEQIDSTSPNLIQLNYKRLQNRILGLFLLSLLAIGLIGGLIYVLQTNATDPLEVADPLELTDPEIGTGEKIEFEQIQSFDNNPQVEHENGVAIELPSTGPFDRLDRVTSAPKKPNNLIKSSKVLRDCWFQVQPFLVELRAETPTGSRFATGTIVDSRGWLLTSYRAVQGASRIDVRQSRSSLNGISTAEPLIDQVRGYLATDPTSDLVLLSINRRFVISLDDLPISDHDNLVGSQFLIQCTPPTQAWPYNVVESRIARRIMFPDFEPGLAKKMSQQKLTDENLRWIQHEFTAPLRIGAPLLDDDGSIVAINTSATGEHEQDVFAVPAQYVLALKQQVGDDIHALPVPYGESDSADGQTTAEQNDAAPMNVVRAGTDLRQISETLNRTGEQCQLFEYWPTSNDESDQLREFVRILLLAQNESKIAESSPESETLARQVTDWSMQLEQYLGVDSGHDRDEQMKFNRDFQKTASPRNNSFIGFGFVHYSAMESPKIAIGGPNKQDSVVFEFMGLNEKIISNLQTDWPALPPDSPWLLIGERLNGQVRLLGKNKKQETLRQSKIQFVYQSNSP